MNLNVHFVIHYLLNFSGKKKRQHLTCTNSKIQVFSLMPSKCAYLFFFLSEKKLPAELKEATASFSKFQNAAWFFHTQTDLRQKAVNPPCCRSGNGIDHTTMYAWKKKL